MGFTLKKGSEKGSKGISRRCLECPLGEYTPLGVRHILDPWFATSMVCNSVEIMRTTEITKTPKTTKTTQTATDQGVECWTRRNHGKHGHDENNGNPGADHGFPKQRV